MKDESKNQPPSNNPEVDKNNKYIGLFERVSLSNTEDELQSLCRELISMRQDSLKTIPAKLERRIVMKGYEFDNIEHYITEPGYTLHSTLSGWCFLTFLWSNFLKIR